MTYLLVGKFPVFKLLDEAIGDLLNKREGE